MSEPAHDVGTDTGIELSPVLRHFEDKRRYPRVDVHTDVSVTTADRQVLRARMRNLSAEGLQLRCDPDTARLLHPRGTQIVPGTGAEVMLRFDLPDGGGTYPFTAPAQLCYLAVRRRDEIVFGARFLHLSLESKKFLTGFLVECMRPAP